MIACRVYLNVFIGWTKLVLAIREGTGLGLAIVKHIVESPWGEKYLLKVSMVKALLSALVSW